ncbi:hypothetical protein ARALYDRAFT_314426 [Arabidopsis lyrata subsp. lyrata]|uniref:O-methyltransferase dimerisation domain-containing protein n=1 Tax=Arabidopsis lyrata subsp. lyrata TaxID=81972 RepID=D7KFX2_ARALL|nr:hypothetical protein ARALYDRAFT_314426 [Arabidopsis lyrata subsp. lyrata]
MTNQLQEPLTNYPKPVLSKEEEQVDEEMMSLQALRITNISLAFPMVFKAALELGVLDTMAAAGNNTWQRRIAFALPIKSTNPEGPVLLDRMLRFLVSQPLHLEVSYERPMGYMQLNRPVCTFFLKRGNESGSLMFLFKLHQSQVFLKTWYDAIQEEKDAFSCAHGMRVFEYIGLDEQFAGMFNHAISLQRGFKDVNTLVDIGGGLGPILRVDLRD